MNKFELILAMALGLISNAIAILKTRPKTAKIERWIKGLKAASAALNEIVGDGEETPTHS